MRVLIATNGFTAQIFFMVRIDLRNAVVDDNSDLAALVSLLLEHCGFEVRTLANGRSPYDARAFRQRRTSKPVQAVSRHEPRQIVIDYERPKSMRTMKNFEQ